MKQEGKLPPIYVMAAITLPLASILWGGLIYLLSGRQARYLLLLLPGLPLSAAVNLLVKLPISLGVNQGVGYLLTASPPAVQSFTSAALPVIQLAILLLLAPLTEEAIKVSPLLLPPLRRWMDGPRGALWVGSALGVSFGLGEAAYLAWAVAQNPLYALYPWYAFTGYLVERTIVCFAHGAITAVLVTGLWKGRWWALLGYGCAVILHTAINVPAVLIQVGWPIQSLGLVSLLLPLVLLGPIWAWLWWRSREPAPLPGGMSGSAARAPASPALAGEASPPAVPKDLD